MNARFVAIALAACCAIAASSAHAEGEPPAEERELQHGQAVCSLDVNRCIVRSDDLELLAAEHKAIEAMREEVSALRATVKQLLEERRGKLKVIPRDRGA